MTETHDLKALEETWQAAKLPRSGSLGDVPDGGYRAVLLDSRLDTIRRGEHKGGPKVVLTFRILEGACRERRVVKHLALTANADRLGFVRRDLAVLGADIEALSAAALKAALEAAHGSVVWLRLATRERFQEVEIRVDLAGDRAAEA